MSENPDRCRISAPPPRPAERDAAQARLAAALKANMARRKAQARARADGDAATKKDE